MGKDIAVPGVEDRIIRKHIETRDSAVFFIIYFNPLCSGRH